MLNVFGNRYFSILLISLIVLGGCTKEITETGETTMETSDPPNILLIIADDMGKDATAGFAEGSLKPTTPNINSIRDNGLIFTNFWVYPTCSPTRASIITGKYGYRTGVKAPGDELENTEKILQQYLNEATDNQYATALIGKWHLAGEELDINPELLGIDYYAGVARGTVQDYYRWQLSEDGTSTVQTTYVTETLTDLSIDWVNQQTKPWFLWLAYNAPHTPFHAPPAEMHAQGALPDYTDDMDATPYYLAAIEAMDYQIGRLLENIPSEQLANTVIIFLGDNGTPNRVAQTPYSRRTVKGTLYQGGINVPLFISGKGIDRTGEENSLISSTDLYSTIAQLAGATDTEIHDSQSFKNLLSISSAHRTVQYSEMTDAWAISNGIYKLIVTTDGNEELYHLENDPYESSNLLDGTLSTTEANAKTALETALAAIRN